MINDLGQELNFAPSSSDTYGESNLAALAEHWVYTIILEGSGYFGLEAASDESLRFIRYLLSITPSEEPLPNFGDHDGARLSARKFIIHCGGAEQALVQVESVLCGDIPAA